MGSLSDKMRESIARHLNADKAILQDILKTLTTRGLLLPISFVTSILLARALGPDGRGVYATAVTLSGFGVQLGILGLHSANTFLLSKDKSLAPKVLGNSIIFSLTAGLLVAVLVLLAKWNQPSIVLLNDFEVLLILIWIPFSLLLLLAQNIAIALGNVKIFNLSELAIRVITLAWIAALAFLGITQATWALAGTVAAAVGGGIWVVLYLCKSQGSLGASWQYMRDMLPFGVKAYLGSLFSFAIIRMDQVIFTERFGIVDAGNYAVAMSIGDIMLIVPSVVGALLYPKLCSLTNNSDRWGVTSRFLSIFGVIFAVGMASVALCSSTLITMLYGQDFIVASSIFRVMAPGLWAYGVAGIFSNFLAALGFPWFAVWLWALVVAAKMVAILFFGPSLTGMGLVLTTAISCFAVVALQWLYIQTSGVKNV